MGPRQNRHLQEGAMGMNIAIIYDSSTGTTAKAAEVMGNTFEGEGNFLFGCSGFQHNDGVAHVAGLSHYQLDSRIGFGKGGGKVFLSGNGRLQSSFRG